MLKKQVKPKEVISYLNGLLKTDRLAIETLFNIRVLCNDRMAKHPTIQVGKFFQRYVVGPIGVINGMFGTNSDGWGCIAMDLDKNNKIKKFRLVRKNDILSSSKKRRIKNGQ